MSRKVQKKSVLFYFKSKLCLFSWFISSQGRSTDQERREEKQGQRVTRKIRYHAWLHLPCGNPVENHSRQTLKEWDITSVDIWRWKCLPSPILVVEFPIPCFHCVLQTGVDQLFPGGAADSSLGPVKEIEMNWDVFDHHFLEIQSTCPWLWTLTTVAPCRGSYWGSVSVRLVSRCFFSEEAAQLLFRWGRCVHLWRVHCSTEQVSNRVYYNDFTSWCHQEQIEQCPSQHF